MKLIRENLFLLKNKQVAIMLYYLSDEPEMRKISNSLGVGKSTASLIVSIVTKGISGNMTSNQK